MFAFSFTLLLFERPNRETLLAHDVFAMESETESISVKTASILLTNVKIN